MPLLPPGISPRRRLRQSNQFNAAHTHVKPRTSVSPAYPQSSRAYSVHCDGVGNDRTRGYTGSRTIVLASGVAISSATIALVLR